MAGATVGDPKACPRHRGQRPEGRHRLRMGKRPPEEKLEFVRFINIFEL